MREIGGYIEFETYSGSNYHENAVALNCGRNCLAYLIASKHIKKLRLPYFLCDSVKGVCAQYDVECAFYSIDKRFRPVIDFELQADEWLYLVNYYGQLDNEEAAAYQAQYQRVIFDNAQSYFQMPVEGMDTLYTCRKYFGVSDGGFLYTDARLESELPLDESFERIHYVLGRFERTAGEFYLESADNNHLFGTEPMKKMSKLTQNLLRSYDYEAIIRRRTENFVYLHDRLGNLNVLELTVPQGAFMYPLYLEDGATIRKQLQEQKIFIPTLWPDVLNCCNEDTLEYDYSKNILPLPVDQRYGMDDMKYMVEELLRCLKKS